MLSTSQEQNNCEWQSLSRTFFLAAANFCALASCVSSGMACGVPWSHRNLGAVPKNLTKTRQKWRRVLEC